MEGLYYPCSENKGADQLRSYCEADLRLCFRLCRLLVFPCGGSNDKDLEHQENLSMKSIVPHRGLQGIPIFLIFDPKHRSWVLVGTALAKRFERARTINVLSKNIF